MIKFFKQPHIIKITTIIITIVLCFNFLPSKVYAYPEKHNIENSRSKKENTKNNILKSSSRYVKFYVQDGYYYNPYIFEIGWNINKRAQKLRITPIDYIILLLVKMPFLYGLRLFTKIC